MALNGYEYFIYVLDIKKGKIAAALHCPDEETADQVFSLTDQRMEEEHGRGWFGFDFDFGIAVTENGDDSHNELEYIAPPRHEKEKWTRKLLCKYNDFILAAMETEKRLRTSRKTRLDVQYMYFVKLALEGKPLPTVEEMAISTDERTPRASTAQREKTLKKAVMMYWIKKVKGVTTMENGKPLTRKNVALACKLEETALSKREAMKYMKRISVMVKEVKETMEIMRAGHKTPEQIQQMENKAIGDLIIFIRDVTK